MGKKIKSAYEIAMENAKEIDREPPEKGKKEKVKPLLAKFFRGKMDAEGLWQELKESNSPELYEAAQELILNSLGLKTESGQFDERKEGILAVESLKQDPNSSILEQYLTNLKQLQQQYKNEREDMQERFEQEVEQNSRMQMKPVQTEDGKTVMKLESGVDEETQKRFNKMLSDFEENYKHRFNSLKEEIKGRL